MSASPLPAHKKNCVDHPDRIRTIKAALFRARCRLTNRLLDALAMLTGYCNHRPWSPVPGEGGGYAHWRCGRKRGHVEMHRSRNYVWSNDGRTDYVPVPVLSLNRMGPGWAAQPRRWERHMIPTLRQARARRRWMDSERRVQALAARERIARQYGAGQERG